MAIDTSDKNSDYDVVFQDNLNRWVLVPRNNTSALADAQQQQVAQPQSWETAGQSILDIMASQGLTGIQNPVLSTAPDLVALTPHGSAGDVGYGQNNQGSMALMELANDIYGGTSGIRNNLINRGNQFLSGNMDVTANPVFAAQKAAAEDLYRLANEDAMANLPGGGALLDALAGNSRAKAGALTSAAGTIAQDELDFLRGYATETAPNQAISATGTAGGIQSELRQQDISKAIADAQLDAAQRATDIDALTTMRGQDVTRSSALNDILATMRGQDVTARGQDVASNTALGGILASLREQDTSLEAARLSAEAARQQAKANAKGGAAQGLGSGVGSFFGSKGLEKMAVPLVL